MGLHFVLATAPPPSPLTVHRGAKRTPRPRLQLQVRCPNVTPAPTVKTLKIKGVQYKWTKRPPTPAPDPPPPFNPVVLYSRSTGGAKALGSTRGI